MTASASICPLCGGRNRCAQADSATPVRDCWCFATPIAANALERLPAAPRNRSCICPRCAQGLPPEAADEAAEHGA